MRQSPGENIRRRPATRRLPCIAIGAIVSGFRCRASVACFAGMSRRDEEVVLIETLESRIHGKVECGSFGAKPSCNDSRKRVFGFGFRESCLCCNARCDSKANVVDIQEPRHNWHQIFLPRISALIHFRFLGSIWRPRYERHCFRFA